MADKVASADIEDVVSSIRRLVSDEGAARRVAPPKAEDDGRLLLTPALRVLPNPDEADGDGPGEGSGPAAGAPAEGPEFEHREPSTLEATIAELEAAVVRHPEFEPDGGENGSVLDLPPTLRRESPSAAGQGVATPRRRLTLGLADTPSDEVAQAPETEPEDPSGGEAVRAADLSGTLRLVEPVAEPSSNSEADTEGAPEAFEEVLLDEETLRQLVVQIVREELQGSLGEQITSNIRKLIRREIHDYFDVRDGE